MTQLDVQGLIELGIPDEVAQKIVDHRNQFGIEDWEDINRISLTDDQKEQVKKKVSIPKSFSTDIKVATRQQLDAIAVAVAGIVLGIVFTVGFGSASVMLALDLRGWPVGIASVLFGISSGLLMLTLFSWSRFRRWVDKLRHELFVSTK